MRLAEVTIDRIAAAPALPLQLPFPTDPRAVRLAERLARRPVLRAGTGRPRPRRRGQRPHDPAPVPRRDRAAFRRMAAAAAADARGEPARHRLLGDRGRAGGRLFEHQRLHRGLPQAVRDHAQRRETSAALIHPAPGARGRIEALAELAREIARVEEAAAEGDIGDRQRAQRADRPATGSPGRAARRSARARSWCRHWRAGSGGSASKRRAPCATPSGVSSGSSKCFLDPLHDLARQMGGAPGRRALRRRRWPARAASRAVRR